MFCVSQLYVLCKEEWVKNYSNLCWRNHYVRKTHTFIVSWLIQLFDWLNMQIQQMLLHILLHAVLHYVQQIHYFVFFYCFLLAEQHTNLFIARLWVSWRPCRDLGLDVGTNDPKLLFSWWGENTNVLCLGTVHQPVCLLRWSRARCLFIEMRCGSRTET